MNSIENNSNSAYKIELKEVAPEAPRQTVQQPVFEPKEEEITNEVIVEEKPEPETTESKIRRSFFDRYVDKIKDFLDNAE
jgi:cell division protein FtsA